MATHSSVLAWRIPGTAEPGGLPSVGSHRVGHDWSDLATVTVIILYLSSFEWSDMLFSFKFSVNSMVRFSVQITNPRFSSVQSLSHAWLFATPWTTARQASLSITNSRGPPKPMSIKSMMPSNHLSFRLGWPISNISESLPCSLTKFWKN